MTEIIALPREKRPKAIKGHTAMLGTLKPKAEVYENVERMAKTRNIAAIPAPCAKVAQLMHNAFYGNKPNFSWDDFTSFPRGTGPDQPINLNLQGFTIADDMGSKIVKAF